MLSDGCDDVGEGGKLEEEAELDACFEHVLNGLLVQVVDHAQAFEAVAHELRNVVVEVLVQEFEILLNIAAEFVNVEENLLQTFFNVR